MVSIISFLKAISASFSISKILLRDYRYFQIVRSGVIRDQSGYLPWFTYPAIEMLRGLDLSDKSVLEFGSGYSTLFWGSHAKTVLSIEHDPEWHQKMTSLIPPNVELQLRGLDAYTTVSGMFDIISIDGYAKERTRYRCATSSLPHLNPGGLMILDNSDWLPATCYYLRHQGLIQIDFSGFVPGNPHTQTTSFFLTRDFRAEYGKLRPVGGTDYNWETALEQELRGKA